jgi:hypothetical protein
VIVFDILNRFVFDAVGRRRPGGTSEVAMSKLLLLSVMGTFAEFERALTRERQRGRFVGLGM